MAGTAGGARRRRTGTGAPDRKVRGVRRSKSYREASSRAERIAKDPKRLEDLFEQASEKSRSTSRVPFRETWAYLMAMIRLIRAYANGSYREIPWTSLILIVTAVIYFVSPIDLIPDSIPFAGYIDDAFVVALVLRAVKDDLDTFMSWETSQPAHA